eukprot:3540442-Rhodomonas_salina.6
MTAKETSAVPQKKTRQQKQMRVRMKGKSVQSQGMSKRKSEVVSSSESIVFRIVSLSTSAGLAEFDVNAASVSIRVSPARPACHVTSPHMPRQSTCHVTTAHART